MLHDAGRKHAARKACERVLNSISGKGGNIALIILYGLGALIGFAGHGSYSDLVIWAGWCLINAVLALVAIIKNGKAKV